MKLKLPYGSSLDCDQLLLPRGQAVMDMSRKSLRLHDGQTVGGLELASTTPPFSLWSPHNSPFSDETRSIAYGNGVWVTVGGPYSGNAGVYRSTDGMSWTLAISGLPTTHRFEEVVFGNGIFLLTERDDVYTSPNGVSWTKRGVHGVNFGVYATHYAAGRWVAVGQQRQISTSTDNGATWGMQQLPVGGNTAFYAVTHHQGTWVAVGSGGTIVTSTNGVNWTVVSPYDTSGVFHNWQQVIYFNGRFVVFSSGGSSGVNPTVRYSTNASTWTTLENQPHQYNNQRVYGSCIVPGGILVVVGTNGFVAHTTDLDTWTIRDVTGGNPLLYAAATDGEKLIVGGRHPQWYINLL